VEVYGTIFAFEESPHRAGLLWAGTDDGRVHISDDGGQGWREITPSIMPEWGTVNSIELSAHDPGRAFLAVQRYRQDDFSPYIFKTDDFGATWKLLTTGTNGIPRDHFVRAVREDPVRKGLIYAGTEFGVYVSLDDGVSWRSLQLDLPVTPVTDLAVKRGDLVVATQGRSYWILDDLSVLRQLTPEIEDADNHLFQPRPAIRWADGRSGGGRGSVGKNPPFGVVVHYVLPSGLDDEEADEVILEFLDQKGEILRSMSSKNPEPKAPNLWRKYMADMVEPPLLDARAGANRWVWNLRLGDASLVDDAVLWGSATGPMVPPGTYQTRLTVGEWSQTVDVVVEPDPRGVANQDEMKARYELAREVWNSLTRSHDAVAQIRRVSDQVDKASARAADDEVSQRAEQLVADLEAIAYRLHQSKARSSQDVLNYPTSLDNQLMYLMSVVESAVGMPTEASYERFKELAGELDRILGDLDTLIDGELHEFEALLEAKGVRQIATGWDGD
jgi:hypothetical protein